MSAIVKRYVNRILAGIITINDVPMLWREKVLKALEGEAQ